MKTKGKYETLLGIEGPDEALLWIFDGETFVTEDGEGKLKISQKFLGEFLQSRLTIRRSGLINLFQDKDWLKEMKIEKTVDLTASMLYDANYHSMDHCIEDLRLKSEARGWESTELCFILFSPILVKHFEFDKFVSSLKPTDKGDRYWLVYGGKYFPLFYPEGSSLVLTSKEKMEVGEWIESKRLAKKV